MSATLSLRASVYTTFLQNAFLKMLAYRLRYVTGILTYLLFASVHYFIWQAVFSSQPGGGMINGFTLQEMVTYVTIGWISRSFYFSNIDEEVDDLVRTGQIGIYLLRPVDFQLMLFSQAIGETIFRLLLFSAPIAAVIFFVFDVGLPASAFDAGCFVLATIYGFFILAGINFLIGMTAFSFKSIEGLMRAKYYLIQLFSGLLLPISFFPDWARVILDVLPFKAIASTPLQFYLGKIPREQILNEFVFETIWLVAIVAAGRLLWSRAFSKLTVQGG